MNNLESDHLPRLAFISSPFVVKSPASSSTNNNGHGSRGLRDSFTMMINISFHKEDVNESHTDKSMLSNNTTNKSDLELEEIQLNESPIRKPPTSSVKKDKRKQEEDEDFDIILSSPTSPNAISRHKEASDSKLEDDVHSKYGIGEDQLSEFFLSAQDGDVDSIIGILEHKNNHNIVNIKDENCYGQTALHYACWNGHFQLVKYLISKKAKINEQNDYKQTPLHEACYRGHVDIVKYLVDCGASISLKDKNEDTAINYATKRKKEVTNFTSENAFKEIVNYLEIHATMEKQQQEMNVCCCQIL
ncbi:hypothetical protein ABK040_004391 [Willaertia magna]